MTPDQIREVFRQALREGDLHEDCSACQERIDAAIAACPPAVVWVVIGHVDYEFDDIQSVHADERSARAERDRLAAVIHATHDRYSVERYEVRR